MRIGPNYNKNKQKAPSAPALLDLVGIDCLRTPARIDAIGSKVYIPDEWKSVESPLEGVPNIFIVNCQLPSEFNTSLFREITDGPGWSLVHYFRLSENTAAQMRDLSTADNAVKLFVDYCRNAPEQESNSKSPYRGKFKVTLRCENIDEFGLPSFITGYNAKPVLIKNTGTMLRSACGSYLEFDINVHRFASLPKKALQTLLSRFERMNISTAFCIESREDDELPETLFGCGSINRPKYTTCQDF